MAVDCVKLLRDYPCRFSFGSKETKAVQTEQNHPKETETSEYAEATFKDAFRIGPGTTFGLGSSALICLWFSCLKGSKGVNALNAYLRRVGNHRSTS